MCDMLGCDVQFASDVLRIVGQHLLQRCVLLPDASDGHGLHGKRTRGPVPEWNLCDVLEHQLQLAADVLRVAGHVLQRRVRLSQRACLGLLLHIWRTVRPVSEWRLQYLRDRDVHAWSVPIGVVCERCVFVHQQRRQLGLQQRRTHWIL
jgi:hypothetical protein